MELVIVAALVGLLPAYIANQKGHPFGLWWLYGAALFIVALPHALVVKPDAKALELRQLAAGSKKCQLCAELVKQEAQVCRFCGRDLPPESGSLATFVRRNAEGRQKFDGNCSGNVDAKASSVHKHLQERRGSC